VVRVVPQEPVKVVDLVEAAVIAQVLEDQVLRDKVIMAAMLHLVLTVAVQAVVPEQ
jgi:ABC-type antimicrobial peptide transport system permease subunit